MKWLFLGEIKEHDNEEEANYVNAMLDLTIKYLKSSSKLKQDLWKLYEWLYKLKYIQS